MGKYTYSGVEYDLPLGIDGETLVAGFVAKGIVPSTIAQVLGSVGKVVATAVKKSADQIFENVKSKTAARADVKETMPQLAKMWKASDEAARRAEELAKRAVELESVVLTAAKEEAAAAGFLAEAIRLGFNSDHKLVFNPLGKGHGGSAPGTTRQNGAGTVTFLTDLFAPKDTVIKGDNKSDLGEQLYAIVKDKWAGMKPSPYQGVMKYNKFFDNFIAKCDQVRYDHSGT